MKTLKFALIYSAFCLILAPTPAKSEGLFTQATPTVAEQTATQLTRGMDMEIQRRVMYRVQAWRSVWENPKATPQAILSALGNNAVKVLTASTFDAGWFTALATATGKSVSDFIDPKFLTVKAGWTITPHQDGTATATPPSD